MDTSERHMIFLQRQNEKLERIATALEEISQKLGPLRDLNPPHNPLSDPE
jgi:hypothetical protein